MSAAMLACLRRVVKESPVSSETWIHWDQRFLRGLYIRGYVDIRRDHSLVATEEGRIAYDVFTRMSPIERKNFKRPTFKR